MVGQRSRGSSKKRDWTKTGVYVAAVVGGLTIAVTLGTTYWGRSGEEQNKVGNAATNTSSSAVVQGGNVGSVTVYSDRQAPQPPAEASPSPAVSPTPSPTVPPAERQPTPKASPKPQQQEPSPTAPPQPSARLEGRESQPTSAPALSNTSSFVRAMISECAKHDRNDSLALGEPYEDSNIGFVVRNIGKSGDDPMLQLKMPTEEKERQIPFHKPYNQSVR